jgi:transcriptional regulator with XRE-family HTH domain
MSTDIGLGDLLRRLRTERGEPLRVVAAAVGIDSTLLSRIERGERLPTAPQVQALSAHFDYPAEELEAIWDAARLMRQSWSADAVWRAADVIESHTSSGSPRSSMRSPEDRPHERLPLKAVRRSVTEADRLDAAAAPMLDRSVASSMSAPRVTRADRLAQIEDMAQAGFDALDTLEEAANDGDSIVALRATELLRQLRSRLR